MATELKKQTAHYRLLHFQPDPEDGDRVCVAILLEENRHFTVLSDPKLRKLRCIAPAFEPELVSFYLRDLEDSLDRSSEPFEVTLRRYAPQLIVSEARSVAAPLTDRARLRLLERFVLPSTDAQRQAAVASKVEIKASEHIRLFLTEIGLQSGDTVIPHARPRELFSRNLPNVKAVAFAIRRPSIVVLVDGVDLRVMTPAKTISKTNQIVHTFWQYGRLQKEVLFGQDTKIERVGIVMNGTSPKTEPYLDAHDYALHQFNNEADLTVDTTSGEGKEQLRAVLAGSTH
jgi:hypothetical protein